MNNPYSNELLYYETVEFTGIHFAKIHGYTRRFQ